MNKNQLLKLFFIAISCLLTGVAFSQTRIVKGEIINEESGEYIEGVKVSIKETKMDILK